MHRQSTFFGLLALMRRFAAAFVRVRSRVLASFFRSAETMSLPTRVRLAIAQQQRDSEILIGWVQAAAVMAFGALYIVSSKAFPPSVPFEPVPWTLSIYAIFTAIRLWLAYRGRLRSYLLVASVVLDMVVLLLTIWSFHLQYQQPPAFYLKAPTLLYVFIIVLLRALRFEPSYVVLAGITAALGWLGLLAYALVVPPGTAAVTHDYVTYMTSSSILIGAEFDKVVSILAVTAILAVSLSRARQLLVQSVTGEVSASELSRFFAPEVARRIASSDSGIRSGDAELCDGAALFIDLRGFTLLTEQLSPANLMAFLAEYQGRMVPLVLRNGGSIDKYIGDGILVSFGAAHRSTTYAADALRAVEEIVEESRSWAVERAARRVPAPAVGVGVMSGSLIFGAIGDASRLEYTVLGDVVNTAAKLEKHTKVEGVLGITTSPTFELACRQGFRPRLPFRHLGGRHVQGIDKPVELIAMGTTPAPHSLP